ncbi:MAG: uroporphyrinogen decarboxylase family protein, partial [Verrucomicrobiota bacterium]
MNSRERILNLIAGKPVDRPPAMPITMMWAADLVGAKYHDYATRAEIQVAGQIAAAQQFGFDHVSVISDPCCEAADLGAAIFYPPDGPPAIIEESALLADASTLSSLRVPDPHRAGSRMANRLEAVRRLREQVGDTHLIEGWVEGPCAESADLRGINTLMTDYYDDADFVHALAAFTVDNALKFATAQIEAGADIIGVGDAAASLVGRELYDEFVFP